jgi:hypothetical protein
MSQYFVNTHKVKWKIYYHNLQKLLILAQFFLYKTKGYLGVRVIKHASLTFIS